MFGKKKEMSENEKKAKLAALKGAHSMASDAMKEGLSGAKKVSVIADSKKGLQKGLDVAEKILGEKDEDSEDDAESMGMGEKEHAQMMGYEDQQESSEPMDEDEIDAEIEKLMKLKEQLQNS